MKEWIAEITEGAFDNIAEPVDILAETKEEAEKIAWKYGYVAGVYPRKEWEEKYL